MRELPLLPLLHDDGNCVRRVPLFAGLTAAQQDLVAQVARPRQWDSGEVVRGAGARADEMLVVHTGKVKLSRTLPSGKERLLRVLEPGDTLDEHTFLHPEATTDTAEALAQTRMCAFSHAALTDLVRQYPEIAVRMLDTLAGRLEDAERQLALSTINVDSRLADYLLQLPSLPGAARGTTADLALSAGPAAAPAALRVRLPLPKKDVASYLGTTPESLSRSLKRLTAKGLLQESNGIVSILDPAGLEDELAEL